MGQVADELDFNRPAGTDLGLIGSMYALGVSVMLIEEGADTDIAIGNPFGTICSVCGRQVWSKALHSARLCHHDCRCHDPCVLSDWQ